MINLNPTGKKCCEKCWVKPMAIIGRKGHCRNPNCECHIQQDEGVCGVSMKIGYAVGVYDPSLRLPTCANPKPCPIHQPTTAPATGGDRLRPSLKNEPRPSTPCEDAGLPHFIRRLQNPNDPNSDEVEMVLAEQANELIIAKEKEVERRTLEWVLAKNKEKGVEIMYEVFTRLKDLTSHE